MQFLFTLLFQYGILFQPAMATKPPITAIAFAPDGKSVIAGSQAGLQVYDWPDMKLGRKINCSTVNIHDLAFSPSSDRLAIAGGSPAEKGVVEILSWPDGKSLHVLEKHSDSVMMVVWRDDSALATASLDREVILWDAKTGTPTRHFAAHSRGVTSLCILDDRKTMVSASIDQSLRVWDLDSGTLIRSLAQHTMPVHQVQLRPGHREMQIVASISDDKTVRFWQPTIGRMVRFARLKSKPLAAEWLPNGSKLAVSCTDGHVRLIDPDSVEVSPEIPAVDGWADSLAVHPSDGSIVVGGSDGQLRRIRLPASK